MKNLFLIFLTFFISFSLHAQWESLGTDIIPPTHRVYSLKLAPDASMWVASTYDSLPPIGRIPVIQRSIDGGNTWRNTEIPEAIDAYASDISPVDSITAYSALFGSGLYKTSDGGKVWGKVETFPYDPLFVHYFNDSEGWVAGADTTDNYFMMSVTSDGGDTWQHAGRESVGIAPGMSLPPIDTTERTAISFSSSSSYDIQGDLIAIGTSNGYFWISTDKGYNWTRKYSPLNDFNIGTSNIAVKDENTFVVAGDTDFDTFESVASIVFTTKDGGVTWSNGAQSPVTATATRYVPDSDSVFVMVSHANFGWGERGTAISTDYGETWEQIDDTPQLIIDFLDKNTAIGACCNHPGQGWFGDIFKWNYQLTTPVAEVNELINVQLSPNPTSDFININFTEAINSKNINLSIFSSEGKQLKSFDIEKSEQLQINVSDLPTGIYILEIHGESLIGSKQFMKR